MHDGERHRETLFFPHNMDGIAFQGLAPHIDDLAYQRDAGDGTRAVNQRRLPPGSTCTMGRGT